MYRFKVLSKSNGVAPPWRGIWICTIDFPGLHKIRLLFSWKIKSSCPCFWSRESSRRTCDFTNWIGKTQGYLPLNKLKRDCVVVIHWLHGGGLWILVVSRLNLPVPPLPPNVVLFLWSPHIGSQFSIAPPPHLYPVDDDCSPLLFSLKIMRSTKSSNLPPLKKKKNYPTP